MDAARRPGPAGWQTPGRRRSTSPWLPLSSPILKSSILKFAIRTTYGILGPPSVDKPIHCKAIASVRLDGSHVRAAVHDMSRLEAKVDPAPAPAPAPVSRPLLPATPGSSTLGSRAPSPEPRAPSPESRVPSRVPTPPSSHVLGSPLGHKFGNEALQPPGCCAEDRSRGAFATLQRLFDDAEA